MTTLRTSLGALALLLSSSLGCELIASVNRDEIPTVDSGSTADSSVDASGLGGSNTQPEAASSDDASGEAQVDAGDADSSDASETVPSTDAFPEASEAAPLDDASEAEASDSTSSGSADAADVDAPGDGG